MNYSDFLDLVEEYQAKFGDAPTIMGLPEDLLDKAASVLRNAIKANEPVEDDDFQRAIGLDPIGDDELP